MPALERRSVPIQEIRVVAGEDGRPSKLFGHAAVFGILSSVMTDCEDVKFREILDFGAFAETIAVDDIYAFRNHDSNAVLGRTKSKTLILKEDPIGLSFEDDLPDASYARDLAVSIGRGDLDQCSFGFSDADDTIEPGADGIVIRRIHRLKLGEISLGVPFAAYGSTSVMIRSIAVRTIVPQISAIIETPGPIIPPRSSSKRSASRRYLETL